MISILANDDVCSLFAHALGLAYHPNRTLQDEQEARRQPVERRRAIHDTMSFCTSDTTDMGDAGKADDNDNLSLKLKG